MSKKTVRTITQREWMAFADDLASIVSQCDRELAQARSRVAQSPGEKVAPSAELYERFEKAAGHFLGERRHILESRRSYFDRVMKIMHSPEQVIATMARNGIRLQV